LATAMISGTEYHLHQNKDRLSVCSILLLQRKPKLGHTKPGTGPQVGHIFQCHDRLSSEIMCNE